MPLYDYNCPECGIVEDIWAGINDKTLTHDKCGNKMKRILSGSVGINMGVGAYGYYDDNLQAYCGTNKEKKRIMQEQNVTEKYGKGWY